MRRSRPVSALFLVVLAAGAIGCPATFRYRNIQTEFMEAARLDNLATVDPLSESTAEASYTSIAAELTPQHIERLDRKLHGNAWVIRSYSQWRSKQYVEALDSARRGRDVKELGPRDRVLLALLPALVVDAEARDKWTAQGRRLTGADYPPFEKAFRQAYGELRQAATLLDASTAPSTTYYVAYQRWRIVNDWRIVIASIDDQDPLAPAMLKARVDAQQVVGRPLADEMRAAEKSIPDWHPLREMIAAQSGS